MLYGKSDARLHVVLNDREFREYHNIPYDGLVIDVRALVLSHEYDQAQMWDDDGNLMWSCLWGASLADVPILGWRDGLPVYSIMGGSPLENFVIESFTTVGPGTWTNPGAGSLLGNAYAGGGGGGQTSGAANGGGGGGGGQFARNSSFLTLTNPGQTNSYNIGGGGGVGGVGTNTAGTQGGRTWFSNTGAIPAVLADGVLAIAGTGGGGGSTGTNGAAGSGSAAGSIGDVTRVGGNGAVGAATVGGGGGGGAGNNNPGSNGASPGGGAGGTNNGGAGGSGGSATTNGGPGSTNGGGGGGGTLAHTAGLGAQGQLAIQYTLTTTNLGVVVRLQGVNRAGTY